MRNTNQQICFWNCHHEHKLTDLLLELSSLTQTNRSALGIIIINTNEQICFWNHHHKTPTNRSVYLMVIDTNHQICVWNHHHKHKPTDLFLESSSWTLTNRSVYIINTNHQICFWNHHHKHKLTDLFLESSRTQTNRSASGIIIIMNTNQQMFLEPSS